MLATRTWSGAAMGMDNNWNNAANWAENAVPVANDDLVFPAGAARLVNVNNLTAGTTFQSLTFTGGGYSITGNAIGIGANGVTNNVAGPSAAGNTLNLPITLAATRTFTITSGMLILGDVVSGAGGLIKAGADTLQLAGSAANTYMGETTVNAGVLELGKTAGTVAVPGVLTIGDGTGAGSDLVRLLANDQIAPATVVTVLGTGTLSLLTFNQTLAGLTLTGGTVQATSGTLTLTGNVTTNAATTSATIGGNLALGASPRMFTVADGAAADDLVVSAVITGSGEVIKAGPGRLVFSGTNTYTGATTVQAGMLNLRNAAALGATSAGTTVAQSAFLELQGGIAVGAEPLTLQAAAAGAGSNLWNVSDNNSWAGNITLALTGGAGENSVSVTVAAGQLSLTGAISGALGLSKQGPGTLVFGGATANTYSGGTLVGQGTLQLGKTAGVTAVAGALTIGDIAGGADSDVVRLAAANQIADGVTVSLSAAGLLDLDGFAETIAGLSMAGGNVTTGAGTLTLNGNVTTSAANVAATISGNLALGGATRTFTIADGAAAEDLVLAAVVSGAAGAGLTKEGPGTLRLGGANTYTGPTTVNAGTLLVNGAQSGSAVTVAAAATLGGSGTVGALTANGTVAPGSGGAGTLRAGDVTFNASATFRAEINGTMAGTGHDQLNVTGSVNLGNATLNASLGFASPAGTQYTILANDGADAVTGTFNGLAEGANLTISGRRFRISYRGGDGNDVVLTDDATPTTTTLTSSAATAVFGQSVTFTAVVAPAAGMGTPTGTVTFRDGATSLGTGALANGRATFTTTTLAVGSRQITAVYEGDATFGASTSAALTQTVNKANTTVTLTVTPNPATLGQTVTLTATVAAVAPGGGTPTGTLTFRDGDATLPPVALGAGGVATLSISILSAGAHSLTAVYAGDANFETSTSAAVNLQVGQALPNNQRVVAQFYLDLLGRAADAPGLAFWSGQLDRNVSRTEVVIAFTNSAEYRANVVRGLFQKYLRRDPDPGGLDAFVRFLGTGGTVEQASAAIVGSAEYFNRQGGTNTGWLNAVYRDVLNRAADASGQAAHLAGLNAGLTRQRIAEVFFRSDEAHRLDVRGLYQRFLRREPDAGGLSAFASALSRGARQEQVIATIAGSAEYAGRV